MRGILGVLGVAMVTLVVVFFVNFQSGSTLVDAAAKGDKDLVAILIDEGHDINGLGKDDWTPLTIAIENDDSSMVLFLLQNGADPNKVVPGGTALDMALRRGRGGSADIVRQFGGYCKTKCDQEE